MINLNVCSMVEPMADDDVCRSRRGWTWRVAGVVQVTASTGGMHVAVFWCCEQGLHAVVLMQQYLLESNLVSSMKDEINLVDGMHLQSSLDIFTAIHVNASSLYPNVDLSRFLLSKLCSTAKLVHQI